MMRSRLLPAAFSLLLVASACRDTDVTGPAGTAPDPDLLTAPGVQAAALPVVDRLDQAVPGFGGFYLDDTGRPTAFLADTSGRGAAVRALREELRRLGLQGEVRVLPAAFVWRDLVRWHALASPAALAIAGVHWTDADEARNRVVVGVGDLQAMARVRTDLTRLGIPAGAVLVERADPVVRVATLRDEVRPVVGGVQIHLPGFLCTLGFNATAGGQASFVTASHCTTTQGGEESTPYWQPHSSVSPTQIAVEADDPDYTSGGSCPAGRVCRRSDAARARYINSTASTLGSIARTALRGRAKLEIIGAWTITAEEATDNFTIGAILNKVGRTTGWSRGRVAGTCIDVNVSGSNLSLFCQTFVRARIGAGDSGAPVFAITSGTSVTLAGLLWGSGGPYFVFSPLKNIEAELGDLTVF